MKLAVKRIMASKTFDNGTICASEQSVVCDEDMADQVQKEMKAREHISLQMSRSRNLETLSCGLMEP